MTYIAVALRKDIIERANSLCEYCRLTEQYAYHSHEIDHIYAEKHGGETISNNLCLACAECNRHKSSDICSIDPESSNIVALFHPLNDVWESHFELLRTGYIQATSATGRVTARLLNFNRLDLVHDRQRLIGLGLYKNVK